jgi:phosphoribosylamine--glycine ligase
VLLPEAKDYKRIGEGDKGLNTGGMGAVSPLPFFDDTLKQKIITTIIDPTIEGLQKDGLDYKGFIFFGLMINNGEPYVIEYNCRLGDPETEVVIPRINNDLLSLFAAVTKQKIQEVSLDIDNRSAVAIVAASGGYPGKHEIGKIISGLDDGSVGDSLVFHAGTAKQGENVTTSAGRVLAVTAFGADIKEASELSNYMMEQLYFEDMYFRSDIGYEFK